MEKLKHSNDIEIKLLANRRFIYANRKQNIVITAEHLATEITVLFPDEYEDYSKRVDFINSQGKEWTEGLYTPEFKNYKPGTSRTRFHFSLPTEVTTEGELKMQFLAYLPDESMTTVPFEIIPIDVQCGMLAFKGNAKSNPDLLILSYNQSAQALFNSQKAVARVESVEQGLADETAERKEADAELRTDLDAEIERAKKTEAELTAALEAETAERTAADNANIEAIQTENERAIQAEYEIAEALAAETMRAKEAEEANAQAIAGETIRAIEVESAISQALASEVSRALTAEQINADAIQKETDRAIAAESNLQADLNAERTRAISAETDLQSQLTAEAARAKLSEAGISADLSNEAARAMTAEQMNETAINNETSRALQAESALGARIDTEVPSALAEAKAYADQAAEQVRIDGTIYKGTVDEQFAAHRE